MIEAKTFTELKEEIVEDLRTSVDVNVNLSPTDVIGQLLNITSYTASELYDEVELVQNNNTILAEGDALDLQLAQVGKIRDRGARARITDFTIVCDGSCTLKTTDYFQNAEGLQFRPIEEETYAVGTHLIDVEAVEIGSIGSLSDDTVDEIVSPVSGLASVNNSSSSDFQDGRDVETDEEARIRIQSESNSKEYTENAIAKAVKEITGVNNATVIDDIANARFEVIVDQTDTSADVDTAICQTIAFVKPAGIRAYSGASSPNKIEETITIGNKSTVKIEYSRVEEVNVYATLTTVPTLTADQKTALKNYIKAWADTLEAGEDLVVYGTNSLFTTVADWTGTEFTSLFVTVSTDGMTYNTSNISVTARQAIRIPTARITVNP